MKDIYNIIGGFAININTIKYGISDSMINYVNHEEADNSISLINKKLIPSEDKEKFVEQYMKRMEEEEEKQRKLKLLEHYKSESSGVPKYLWNESLETYKPINPYDEDRLYKIRKFVNLEDNSLVLILSGSNEKGKDLLGAGLIYEKGGIMVSMEELIIEYKSCMQFYSKVPLIDFFEKYNTQPMIVINKINTIQCNFEEKNILEFIVNKRHENLLPSCLITPLSINTFENTFTKSFQTELDNSGIFFDTNNPY